MILWRNALGAAVVLIALWLALLGLHGWLEYVVDAHFSHAHQHWGWEWARAAVENLQSEVWQVALAAWVFKHFLWQGSPESKEG